MYRFNFLCHRPAKIGQKATEQNYQLREQQGQIANVVQENILSQSVVKLFGLQTRTLNNFDKDLQDIKTVYVQAKFSSYLIQRIPSLVFVFVQLAVIGIGAVMTYRNIITVGTLVSFQVLLVGLNSKILSFTFSLPYLIDGIATPQGISVLLAEFP